ncbi:protein of unknown function [Micromonospora phaseoli]|uniref:DUF4178 domain-containing protein n=1 Tax=Micromonospora phaseoli TaxID=1144548 RepID=A0A1H7BIV5_9ACTN|nr:DUF4178 domain-containing protein [Micromonospora phaseoli]PZV94942.1 uncharacterized protein DUF4178 [Micromonospora phaseoli]GIJ79787.1 hypothetical protein Xph01_42190 [Micromonospora phaseoli]SEJ77156.1 protein of unknown function [Micromonospora phaseoli]
MDGAPGYLVALGCLAGLVVVVAVLRWRRRDRSRRPLGRRRRSGGSPRRDPRRIEVGDIVEIGDIAYPVRGSIRLVEGEWSWAQHLFDDGDGRRRLSVAEDPGFELVLWEPAPRNAAVDPGAPIVELHGRRYSWHESGQARYTASGSTGLASSGTVRYHDYRAPGGARLTFEAYGEAGWEMARGERLDRGDVTVHPQSGS